MEILHKARDRNNKWYEGWYRQTTLQYDIYGRCNPTLVSTIQGKPRKENDYIEHCVDESTICVYSGFVDRKGNKIFEHDIIAVYQNGEKKPLEEWEVVFCNGCFVGQNLMTGAKKFLYSSEFEYEVIGNAFDISEEEELCTTASDVSGQEVSSESEE